MQQAIGRITVRTITIALSLGLSGEEARAQTPEAAPSPTPQIRFGAYVEGVYQWNTNRPSNGITNFRGFDNRHNAFTLANAALDAVWSSGAAEGRLTLQAGNTPEIYYLSEPDVAGVSGAAASGRDVFKHVQQAYGAFRFGSKAKNALALGVLLSPIGPEGMAVKDNINFSRSNLFFGLPFYHSGVRYTRTVSERLTVNGYALNGWNNIVDNNGGKTFAIQVVRTARSGAVTSALYMTGVERPRGAVEGQPLRHLLDAHHTFRALSRLELVLHGNTGFERNALGTSHWIAAAAYARAALRPDRLFLGARFDRFNEHTPSRGGISASSIFWPAAWVESGTLTLDYRPAAQASLRFEARHDRAAEPMFFGRDGGATPPRKAQTTLSLGLTTWF